MSTKQRRPILSCLECKRKKLKCDRNLPCQQCSRLGRAVGCQYDTQEAGSPQVEGVRNTSTTGLEDRVSLLEERILATRPPKRIRAASDLGADGEDQPQYSAHTSNEAGASRFASRHHWTSLQPEVSNSDSVHEHLIY
jgi:hypothetical protein